MPFGAFNPLTQSTAIIFPSRPIFAMEPFPSLPQGSVPSMLDAYNTLLSPSNNTDSGAFKTVSVSHSFVSLCWAKQVMCRQIEATTVAPERIDFMIECLNKDTNKLKVTAHNDFWLYIPC